MKIFRSIFYVVLGAGGYALVTAHMNKRAEETAPIVAKEIVRYATRPRSALPLEADASVTQSGWVKDKFGNPTPQRSTKFYTRGRR